MEIKRKQMIDPLSIPAIFLLIATSIITGVYDAIHKSRRGLIVTILINITWALAVMQVYLQ